MEKQGELMVTTEGAKPIDNPANNQVTEAVTKPRLKGKQAFPLNKRVLRQRPNNDASASAHPAHKPQRKAQDRPKKPNTAAPEKGKGEEWEVEEIVDSRIEEKTMQHWYKVKWRGFSSKNNTWEPKRNLTNCRALVERYERKAAKKK